MDMTFQLLSNELEYPPLLRYRQVDAHLTSKMTCLRNQLALSSQKKEQKEAFILFDKSAGP